MVDRGEMDAQEAEELFDRLGVKLSLTKAYNPEANRKVECGHRTIVKALVRALEAKSEASRGSYPMRCGRTGLRTVR